MAVSLKDIANKLNLSTATVSLTLSGQGDARKVNKVTQQRVFDCARELNYKPNVLARSLNTGYSQNLGLIVPDITDSFFSQLSDYIEQEAEKRGYTLMICTSRNDYMREMTMIDLLQQKRVDGLLIAPLPRPADCLYSNLPDDFPVVAIDQLQPQWKGSVVVASDRKSSHEIVSRMIRRGARHIALLCVDASRYSIQERVQGYRDALQEANMSFDGELYAELSVENYREEIPSVLDHVFSVCPQVDAFFFTTHMLVDVLVCYFHSHGLKFTSHYQFACFHGSPVYSKLLPSISIVQMPLEEMAMESVRLLCDQIEGRKKKIEIPRERLVLDCTIG